MTRLSAKQIRELTERTGQIIPEVIDAHEAKADKFGRADKEARTWTDGDTSICFDSKREMLRWIELLLLLRSGEISDLRRQVSYLLIDDPDFKMHYQSDFVYIERGQTVVEDVKGFQTRAYKQKRRLMLKKHGITIKETT
jgi:hypothetical protein